MKIGIIVQARMNSQRLPSKVLALVNGKPLLQYLLERLKMCSSIDKIIVATSDEITDDPIEQFCSEYKVICYRGSLKNVAERFYMVINQYNLDFFVRVCADSPLLDFKLIDHAVNLLDMECDIVTNILPRTFPSGQSVEVIKSSTFKKIYKKISQADDLEHVTKYFYDHQNEFNISNFTNFIDLSSYRLAVDTFEDLKRIKRIIESMKKSQTENNLNDLIEIYPSTKKLLC